MIMKHYLYLLLTVFIFSHTGFALAPKTMTFDKAMDERPIETVPGFAIKPASDTNSVTDSIDFSQETLTAGNVKDFLIEATSKINHFLKSKNVRHTISELQTQLNLLSNTIASSNLDDIKSKVKRINQLIAQLYPSTVFSTNDFSDIVGDTETLIEQLKNENAYISNLNTLSPHYALNFPSRKDFSLKGAYTAEQKNKIYQQLNNVYQKDILLVIDAILTSLETKYKIQKIQWQPNKTAPATSVKYDLTDKYRKAGMMQIEPDFIVFSHNQPETYQNILQRMNVYVSHLINYLEMLENISKFQKVTLELIYISNHSSEAKGQPERTYQMILVASGCQLTENAFILPPNDFSFEAATFPQNPELTKTAA